MKEVKESDWRLFRKKLPLWQEAYMETLIKTYQKLLSDDEPASKKFWTLKERIACDSRKTGVMAEIRRSVMKTELIQLLDEGAVRREDLNDFSEELQEEIDQVLEDRKQSV